MSSENLSAFDRLRNDLKRVVCAVSIIQTAMAEGVVADEGDAHEALFCVWEKLHSIYSEISLRIDNEYDLRRGKGAEKV